MTFYRVAVEFRNAVEAMQHRHGRLDDPEHRFWGIRWGPPRLPPQSNDDDGLAASRVPKRPRDGAGGAVAMIGEPPADDEFMAESPLVSERHSPS
jgi:hypothetical protein